MDGRKNMEWVERRIKERADIVSRRLVIEKSVSDIWMNLAAAVRDSVKAYGPEADKQGFTLRTNGQGYVTIVVYREMTSSFSGEFGGTITIGLDRNKPEISVTYEGKPKPPLLRFSFDVNNGTPSLMHEKVFVAAERAVELILDPFLFPDLVSR